MAGALAFGGLAVPASAAPGDNSEARAQFLGSDLLGQQLADVGTAESGSPSNPDGEERNPLNLGALELLQLELAVIGTGAEALELPLTNDGTSTGLLDLGSLGAIQNYAAADSDSAVAASGLLNNDGTIAISENADPADFGNATINLTSLLGQLGIADATGPVLDQLSLEVGALASRISMGDDGVATAEYRVADLKANLHSALVAALTTRLRDAGVTVAGSLTTPLNGLVGPAGPVDTVLSTVDPVSVSLLGLPVANATLRGAGVDAPLVTVTLADLGAAVSGALGGVGVLVSDDGAVTIDLSSGLVSVDLASIVNDGGQNLNGLDPNTRVFTPETLALITSGVTSALGKILDPVTDALELAVRQSRVDIALDVSVALLGGLEVINAPITIGGTLLELSTGGGTVDASAITLLSGVPLCVGQVVLGQCVGVNLNGLVGAVVDTLTTAVAQPVLASLRPVVAGIITSTDATISSTLNAVVDPLTAILAPVLGAVADVRINEQPHLSPAQGGIGVGDLGPGSATVRALSVTLLPGIAGSRLANIDLASSSVRAVPAPAVDIVQTSVVAGDTVQVNGAAWEQSPPGVPVTAIFTNAVGTQIGATVAPIAPDGTGAYAFDFVIPATAVGQVTVTATQGDFSDTDVVDVAPAPQLNVLEGSVVSGEQVQVTGANWIVGTDVSITFTDGATPIPGTLTATPGPDGSFSVPYTVVATTGPVTATATQLGRTAVDTVQLVEAGDPIIDITEQSIVAGNGFEVTGSGWDTGAGADDVVVEITDAEGSVLETVTAVLGAGGSFSFDSAVVPVGTTGPVVATATQGDDEAEDSVVIIAAPAISLEPETVVEGGTVTVAGSGWDTASAAPVTIQYQNGTGVFLTQDITLDPAQAGAFETSFIAPPAADGDVTATATQDLSTAEDDVEVTAAPAPPSVAFADDAVVAGTTAVVTGAGWQPGLTVTLEFSDATGALIDTETTSVVGGAFEYDWAVPASALGVVTVTASQTPGGPTATDTVQVNAAPTLSVTEAAVVEGGQATVVLGNWDPASPVTLTAEDSEGEPVGLPAEGVQVDVDDNGSFTYLLDVPLGTSGIVTVTGVQGGFTRTDTFRVDDAPVFAIAETTVPAGQPVTYSGTGWLPGPVTITFGYLGGEQIGDEVVVTAGLDGTFADQTFTTPVDGAGRIVEGVASQTGRDDVADTVALTTALVPPSVDIAEETVIAGETIAVTGQDWNDVLLVYVTVVDDDGTELFAGFVGLDAQGGFELPELTVPVDTRGIVTATATDGTRSDTDAVEVTAPATVDITETTVVAGQPIGVTGAGWVTGEDVLVVYTVDGVEVGRSLPLPIDGTRAFATSFTVPSGVEGTLTATATQGPVPRSDTDTVAVTAAPPTAPFVDIVEETVVAGETIAIEGGNWVDGEPISIVYLDGDSVPFGASAPITLVDGAFSIEYIVPVGTVGPLTAIVTQGGVSALDDVEVTAAAASAPSTNIVEDTVVAGKRIEITGANWQDTLLSIAFTDATGASIGAPLGVTPVDGSFSRLYTVPVGTVGPVRAIVSQADDRATDTVAVTSAPVVDIVEDTVVAGQPITVNGDVWNPEEPLTIVFTDGDGLQVGPAVVLTPEDDGSFGIGWTVPVGTVGPVRVTVTQGDDVDRDTVLVTAAAVGAPTVDIVQTTVVAGQPVTVNGSGWTPNVPLTITFSGDDGVTVGTVELTPATDDFTVAYTVPPTALGTLRAIVTQDAASATDTVLVTAAPAGVPDVDIVEDTVVAGEPITVEGSGWTPDTTVTIVYTDAAGVQLGDTVLFVVDENGEFIDTFVVPVGTVGPVQATVSDGTASASDTVAVTPATVEEPLVDIVEDTVVAGDPITVEGEGWEPDVDVTIVYTDGNGVPLGVPVVVTTGGDGGFDTSFTVPVGTVGPVQATVTQGDDSATDTVAVTPAPAEAPTGNIVETTVVTGSPITLEGEGWNSDAAVGIRLTDSSGAQIGALLSADPDEADGAFSTTTTLPAGVLGVVRATFTQGDDQAVDTVEVTAAPSVNIVEETAQPGDTVTVVGENWTPGEPVTIVFTDGDGVPVGDPVIVTPLPDGSFETEFEIPEGTTGPLTATVTQGGSEAVDTVAIPEVVEFARVQHELIVRATGVDQRVFGTGFEPGEDVWVTIDTADFESEPVVADSLGEVEIVIPIHGQFALGEHRVEVTGEEAGDLAVIQEDTDFEVVEAAAVGPNGTVGLRTIARGTGVVQTVTGASFQPGETVSATVNSTPFGLTAQVADANGVVRFSFPVGADFDLGAHRVELVGSVSGEVPLEREDTAFTVVTSVSASAGQLASTGFDAAWLAGLAMLLLLAGVGTRAVRRRSAGAV